MTAIFYLIPISLILGGLALAGFFWTLRNRQYDDPEGDSYRILENDDKPLDADVREALRRHIEQ